MTTGQQRTETPFRLSGVFQPETLDVDKRTVDVVAITDTPILRTSWDGGQYWVQFRLSEEAVDLSRYQSGAPVLWQHDQKTLPVGVIERSWVTNDRLIATVRFSRQERGEEIFQEVRDGIIRSVSMGANFKEAEEAPGLLKGLPLVQVKWIQPFELSFCNVPVCPESLVLSESESTAMGKSEERKAEEESAVKAAEPAGESGAAEVRLSSAAAPAEAPEPHLSVSPRTRQVQGLATEYGLEAGETVKLMDSGLSGAALCDQAFRLSLERRAAPQTAPVASLSVTEGDGDKLLKAAGDWFEGRIGQVEFSDQARQRLGHCSTLEVCRHLLSMRGVHDLNERSRPDIVELSLSRSDLPNLMGPAVNRMLVQQYQSAEETFEPLVRPRPVPDFRSVDFVSAAGYIQLQQLPEGAEIKLAELTDGKESGKVARYAQGIEFTYEMLINDDLSAINQQLIDAGNAVSTLEGDLFWSILTGNRTMSDGNSLFSAPHGNLASSGSAITITALDAVRQAMALQTNLAGKKVRLRPRFLLVPTGLWLEAWQLLNPTGNLLADSRTGDNGPSPYGSGSLVLIDEDRLQDHSATSWYMAADPGRSPGIYILHLQGSSGSMGAPKSGRQPITTQRQTDTLGVRFNIMHTVGFALTDHRPFYRNPGA